MRLFNSLLHLIALASIVLDHVAGQGTATKYCDPATSICYSGFLTAKNVLFGFAIPEATAAPFDVILQITSPRTNGWVGFAWGGTMAYVPLTMGWVNNASSAANTTIFSSRMAYGLSLPRAYADASYSYLKGTGFNDTHWTLNVRCRGCSQWKNVDGNLTSLDPHGSSVSFAHAYSTRNVIQPGNNASAFNVHSGFDHWTLDLSQARNANYEKWLSANLIPDVAPPTSSKPPTSSTPAPTTTIISTSIPSTSAPVQTGVPSSCSGVNAAAFQGVTKSGWKAVKVAGNLIAPRTVAWDPAGNLLALQNGEGVSMHTIGPNGCFRSSKLIISQHNLNHGLVVSQDGKTLYASSATSVFAWDYNPNNGSVSSASRVVISGMASNGHVTRTLVFPPKYPNLLIVSHGSNDNFDWGAGNIRTGRSSVKVFDMTKVPNGGYNHAAGGYQMGYGLRNVVGMDFDANGMLWGVENSSDEITRTVGNVVHDVHADNPADELNYLGDPAKENVKWYGYPTCYSVWKPQDISDKNFTIGDQFVQAPNATFNDTSCKEKSTPATLAIAAHSAPLDCKFSKDATEMYVTFHGSSDRRDPTGYKIVQVPFKKGTDGYAPVAPLTSNEGYEDLWWNSDVSKCSATQCFRPVSMAPDKYGRIYVSSDSSMEGEIWMLGKE